MLSCPYASNMIQYGGSQVFERVEDDPQRSDETTNPDQEDPRMEINGGENSSGQRNFYKSTRLGMRASKVHIY